MKIPEKRLYLVVCKNDKQAQSLFERVSDYWKRSSRSGHDRLRIEPDVRAVMDPFDCVMFRSERKILDLTSHSKKPYFRAYLVNGDLVDKWLDKKEKENGARN